MAQVGESRRRKAVFMAFGTKGDVHPIAAIAAAFACDQIQYQVFLITHSAHQNLNPHLAAKNVSFMPISTPPVVPAHHSSSGYVGISFSTQKKIITKEHRKQCLDVVGSIFGDDPCLVDDFIVINFFALEGWSLAELFQVRCVVAAPYVVPHSVPLSFESQFKKEMPLLYKYLQIAPSKSVCWKDVTHWMWPLFTEDWGSWRSELNLSPCPFTVFQHHMFGRDLPCCCMGLARKWWNAQKFLAQSSIVFFSFVYLDIVTGYWPSNVRVCGFWFVPMEWQFTCNQCRDLSFLFSERHLKDELCLAHTGLLQFLTCSTSPPPIFIGFSSVGSMGFLKNSRAFLRVLEAVMEITSYRFILFTAGYEPLDSAIQVLAGTLSCSEQKPCLRDGALIKDRLFCFSGDIPYNWLFRRCAVSVHHGGSGSTAAALSTGLPQVICPFLLDQFYWAERMFWLGVAPEPLQKKLLFPDECNDTNIWKAANALSSAISSALSPEIKARALEIEERISSEDGVGEAVEALKEEINSV